MYVMGIDPTSTSTTALFFPGTLGAISPTVTLYTAPMGTTGSTAGANPGDSVWVYVQFGAGGATANRACVIDHAFGAVMVTTTNGAAGAGQGKMVGVAQVAQAANSFGWLQVFGKGTVEVVAATTLYTALFTTATPGSLNHTVTGTHIDGIVISAITNTTKGACFMNWPKVAGAAA